MITLERNHDSLRSHYSCRSARAGSGPAFSNSRLLANHSLVICGPQWSCARGCSPPVKALLQLGHPESCLRARQAGTSCSHSPLSAQPWAAEMDVISRTSCARTHTCTHGHTLAHTHNAHSPSNAARTRARAWTFPFCARFAGPELLLLVFSFLSFIASSFASFLLDPPGWLLPLCPGGALAYSSREEPGPQRCALHAQRGPSSGTAGTKGLASGLRPVCFPFAP